MIGLFTVFTVIGLATAVRVFASASGRSRSMTRLPLHDQKDPRWLKQLIERRSLMDELKPRWKAPALLGPAAGFALLTRRPVTVVLTVAFCAALVLVWRSATKGRGARQYEQRMVTALDEVARALRSGLSLVDALKYAVGSAEGQVQSDLSRVASAADRGEPVSEALAAWRRRTPKSQSVSMATAAMSVGLESGGNHARAIEGVVSSIRQREAVLDELRAQSAQVRLSMTVLIALPLVFTFMLGGTDAGARDFLLNDPRGAACLATGLGLDGVAFLWMQRMASSLS